MHGFLTSSIGVTCAAALALPLTAAPATATAATGRAAPASAPDRTPAGAYVPGSTQSLPLAPLTGDRASTAPGIAVQGVPRRDTRRFSLVGVVWDDPATALHGRVQIRTRATETGAWSDWQDLETHNADHAADPGTAEGASGGVRGATAPLWVGDSDGVEVRVRAADENDTTAPATTPLPTGMRLELVDPGEGTPPQPATDTASPAKGPRTTALPPGTTEAVEPAEPVDAAAAAEALGSTESAEVFASVEGLDASAANAALAPLGATEIPALSRLQTEKEALTLGTLTEQQKAKPYVGPRPGITTRRGWGADEKLREKKFVYTKKVKAAFVHHSATGNNYRCSQAPSVIRGIYRYHVKSMRWRDIGYNFLVDKCGKIYEGRAGGVSKPVLGAHTMGFNSNSMGIAVLGTYGSKKPSSAAVKAVARLTAWKLGLYGVNPRGKTYLKSGGGNLYRKGKNVRLNVISGHRDGFSTSCPGTQLYKKLGSARSSAAKYQGR
ncbi:peptidoglycan recognition protein [Streptomyces sp. SID5910]|uniref:peptidoglycan recognition protein family protein n=1 Tax=Streptomyces sp. SID5910 TaxID=2690312 RepID=UPI00136DA9C3|nr:peptidoglycan recognition protein [Streptomyces sp. SID5910]MYR40857.1 N-acetylmuramoyl-L-alanine amidase [Streptomyces sp. SID5910]MYR43387.1 N-acetylmuramoyl-L-alanine amidase [Streptomyces sp. SID5910]